MTSFSNYGPTAPDFGSARWQGASSRGWRPFEVAALVISFAFWWPLGLALLGFKLAQRRGYRFEHVLARAREAFSRGGFGPASRPWQPFAGSTGNSAFDDWRAAEMARLEEERRRLDAAQKEFAEHLSNLRRARDKEEFEGFMAARNKPASSV